MKINMFYFLVLATGCNGFFGGNESEDTNTTTTDTTSNTTEDYTYPDDFDIYQGDAKGNIYGTVLTSLGKPLADAEVSILGNSTITNEDGVFELTEVSPGSVVVSVDADGFVSMQREVALSGWETRSLLFKLAPIGKVFTFEAEEGGVFQHKALTLDIPANAFVNGAGEPVTGEITLEVTPSDIPNKYLEGAPGDFRGVTAQGLETPILSFGFFTVTATQGPAELNLADGVTVGADFEVMEDIPQGQADLLTDTIPLWWWNPAEAVWEEEGTASVEDGIMHADLPHFSAWNYDYAYQSTCMEFQVVDPFDNPMSGAYVDMAGVSYYVTHYVGAEAGTTDSEGKITLWGLPNAETHVTASMTIYGVEWTEEVYPFNLYDAVTPGSVCPYSAKIVLPFCVLAGDISMLVANFWETHPDGLIEGWTTPSGEIHYYDPMGKIEQCRPEWIDMEYDGCEYYDEDTSIVHIPEERQEIPAGDITRISNSVVAVDFTPYEDPNGSYYAFQPTGSSGFTVGSLVDHGKYDLKVQGEAGGLPGFEAQAAISVPKAPEFTSYETLSIDRSQDLELDLITENDPNGVFIMMSSPTTGGTVMCRFEDEGIVTVPKSALQYFQPGEMNIAAYRMSFDLVEMPTGFATRSTTLNTTGINCEVK